MSSVCDTSGLGGEDESASVAGEEEIDRLPPAVDSGRTDTPG